MEDEKIKIKELVIYLTNNCNLNCSMCFVDKNNPISLDKSDLDWIKNTFDARKTIFMGGEPLMYPDLKYALELFKNPTIATNGTLIPTTTKKNKKKNNDIVSLLKKHKVMVQLSIEGGKTETDLLRGTGMWDNTVKLLQFLVDQKIDVCLRSGVWDGNINVEDNVRIDTVDMVLELGKDYGVPVFLFPRIDKPVVDMQTQIYLFNKVLQYDDAVVYQPHFFQYIGNPNGHCGAGDQRLGIHHDKKITPCYMDFNYVIGNIGDDIHRIHSGIDVFVNSIKQPPRTCIGCSHKNICKGSCFASGWGSACSLSNNISIKSFINNDAETNTMITNKMNNLSTLVKDMGVC